MSLGIESETHDVGRFYFFFVKDKPPRLVERAESQEVDPPFRTGRGISVSITRRWAVIMGVWSRAGSDEPEYGARKVSFTVEEIRQWH